MEKNKISTILAVDVGKSMGISVMRDGVIVYADDFTFTTLSSLRKTISSVVADYNPDIIVSGRPTRFPQVIASHSKYLAILELVCEANDMQYHEIIDSQAKKTVFGTGVMAKDMIQKWANDFTGRKLTQDCADSVMFCEYVQKITKGH